eukprot:TRINITY_DN10832_c0_g1_i1.p1 TRINITY_DN10832_c0_g1~~TRINITY_DN10832_c0_g1_i1.p1  ORF type:complete len:265 (-),score=39.55 TRINITY_DN10832_c0_g1_i1:516-1310(-)
MKSQSICFLVVVVMIVLLLVPNIKIDSRMTVIEENLDLLEIQINSLENTVGNSVKNVEGVVAMLDQIPSKHPVQYLTIVTGYGPNNQYLGLKDVLFITKALNRTFGLPDFIIHVTNEPNPFRPFEKTFDPKPIRSYVNTVTLDEYKSACEGVVNTLIWLRRENEPVDWYPSVNRWMRLKNLTWQDELKTPSFVSFQDQRDVRKKLELLKDTRCVAIMFPFRNVALTEERRSLDRILVHSKEIKHIANLAFEDFVTPVPLMCSRR